MEDDMLGPDGEDIIGIFDEERVPLRAYQADAKGARAAAQAAPETPQAVHMGMQKIIAHRYLDLPPPEPRVEIVLGLINEGEVAMLTGAQSTGKSTLAALLTEAITRGTPFLGRQTSPGCVVYVAAERAGLVRRRIEVTDFDAASLVFVSDRFQIVEDLDELIAAIRRTGAAPKLLIIDTLAKVTIGVDENSTREWGRVAEALGQLAEAFPGSAVAAIHHLSKARDGTSSRGSGAMTAAVDLELRVSKSGSTHTLTMIDANDHEEGQKIHFKIEQVEGETGPTTLATMATEAEAAPPTKAGKRPDQSLNDLAEALPRGRRISRKMVREVMKGLGQMTAKSGLPLAPASEPEYAKRAMIKLAKSDLAEAVGDDIIVFDIPLSPQNPKVLM